jgi:hypothetical protein
VNPRTGNFGIAHTGVTDPHGDLLPVRVETSVNCEKPEVGGAGSVSLAHHSCSRKPEVMPAMTVLIRNAARRRD